MCISIFGNIEEGRHSYHHRVAPTAYCGKDSPSPITGCTCAPHIRQCSRGGQSAMVDLQWRYRSGQANGWRQYISPEIVNPVASMYSLQIPAQPSNPGTPMLSTKEHNLMMRLSGVGRKLSPAVSTKDCHEQLQVYGKINLHHAALLKNKLAACNFIF